MDGYDATTYGERIADAYDDLKPGIAPAQIDLLSELAETGPVLELGIGTGRVALPLAERGLEVHGIDSSPAMVAKLRQKAGTTPIAVTMGDFGSFDLPTRFSLVFVAFNTLFALAGLELQDRWDGWDRRPYTATSFTTVSVWKAPLP